MDALVAEIDSATAATTTTTIPIEIPVRTVFASWSAAANAALGVKKPQPEEDDAAAAAIIDDAAEWVLLCDVHVLPEHDAIAALWREAQLIVPNAAAAAVTPIVVAVTGQILYSSGYIRSAGVTFTASPSLAGEQYLPYGRYRGVPYGYAASLSPGDTDAWNGAGLVMVRRAAVVAAGGWNVAMEPHFHHADLSLHLTHLVSSSSSSSSLLLSTAMYRIRYTPRAVAYVSTAITAADSNSIAESDMWDGFQGSWVSASSFFSVFSCNICTS